MSWLRLDDGFAAHPKLVQLTDRDFRTWIRVLCWCARYHTKGVLPHRATEEITGLTAGFAQRATALHLLDSYPNSLGIVHDWELYNGSLEERVASYLDDYPDATANQVFRAIGGKRNPVMAIIAQYRTGTPTGTPTVPQLGTQSGTTRADPSKERARTSSSSSVHPGPQPNHDPTKPLPEHLDPIITQWRASREPEPAHDDDDPETFNLKPHQELP